MIWAGIVDGITVGLWRVSEEIQVTAETYIAILKEHPEPCSRGRKLHSIERRCSCKITTHIVQ